MVSDIQICLFASTDFKMKLVLLQTTQSFGYDQGLACPSVGLGFKMAVVGPSLCLGPVRKNLDLGLSIKWQS